jgi:hypothetical protein
MDSINMRLFVWQDGVVRPPAETIPEHLAILDALRRGDPDAGEAAMRLHIRRSLEQLQREAAADAAGGGEAGPPPALYGGVRGRAYADGKGVARIAKRR